MILRTMLFFLVFILFTGGLHYYIYTHLRQVFQEKSPWTRFFPFMLLCLLIASIAILFLDRLESGILVRSVHLAGSLWFGAIIYLFMILLCIDLARLILIALDIMPALIINHYPVVKKILFCAVLAATGALLCFGYRNASRISVNEMTIAVHKKTPRRAPLNIVMMSDLHLGQIIGRERLERIVDTVNALKPDIVLMPGDIIDSVIGPFVHQDMGAVLGRIRPALGIYASTGNHEFFGDLEHTIAELSRCGIVFLRDRAIMVDESLWLIGRDDRSAPMFTGKPRKRLAALMPPKPDRRPVIVLDHTPGGLGEAADAGADLQLSGHTHNGQFFPGNIIVARIFELAWGYLRKGDTQYYVSCGVGTWGPPIRLGSRAEIVRITLTFAE